MAEKDQEHLRIRLGARLLKKIDAAREKSGRTRTDEIEARLLDSFTRVEAEAVAELAVIKILERIDRLTQSESSTATANFYDALVGQFRQEKSR